MQVGTGSLRSFNSDQWSSIQTNQHEVFRMDNFVKAWSIRIAVVAKLIVSTFTMYIADMRPNATTAYLDNLMDYFDDAYMLTRLITVILLIIAVCFVGARIIPSV